MIRLELPYLPPSSNKAYVDLPRGGRTLSTEGKKFKRETTALFAQKYMREMTYLKKNTPYGLVLKFHLASLENKGFATGKAESRYKVLDGGNRTKLLEDALKDAGGIDDSQMLWTLWQKTQAVQDEKTELWLFNLEEEGTDINVFLARLT